MTNLFDYFKCLNCQSSTGGLNSSILGEGCSQCQGRKFECGLFSKKSHFNSVAVIDKCPNCSEPKMIDILNWSELAEKNRNQQFFPKTKEEFIRNSKGFKIFQNLQLCQCKQCNYCKDYFTELFEDEKVCDACAKEQFHYSCRNGGCGKKFYFNKLEYAHLSYPEVSEMVDRLCTEHEKNECPNRITVISLSAPVEQDNNNPNQNIPFLFY